MLDFLKKQFVNVIQWQEHVGQIAWRVPFIDQEIQNGAQLTVREGQIAAFVTDGQLADYFGPGLHTLETANLPILSSLLNWDKAFKSPFKSDVVFLSLKEQLGLRWGTAQPVTVRDRELGPLRLRAFGTYSFRLKEIAPFVSRVLGTLGEITAGSLEPQLRAAIQTALATALGGSDIAFIDLAADQQKLSNRVKTDVDLALAVWGLECSSFFVESVSLPDDVQAHIDKATSMRVLGDLSQYARFQAADAIETAAQHDGAGLAGIGAGVAAAAALGGVMTQGLGTPAEFSASPSPQQPDDPLATIEKLHRLVEIGALSQAEFDAKKAELLSRIR